MGSWFETCQISHLPIFARTPVVYLILEGNPVNPKNSHSLRGTYSTAYWMPKSLPLYGTYSDDYGTVERWAPMERALLSNLLEELSPRLLPREEEDGSGVSVRKEDLNPNNFRDWIHRGQVWVGSWDRTPVPWTKVLIRRDVWKSVLEMEVLDWRNEKVSFPRLLGEIPELLDDPNFRSDKGFFDFMFGPVRETPASYLRRFLVPPAKVAGGMGIDILREELFRFFKGSKADPKARKRAETYLRRFAEISFVNLVFEKTRRNWDPTTGSGSQDLDYETHLDLNARVGKIAYRETRMRVRAYSYLSEKTWGSLSDWEKTSIEEARANEAILLASRVLGPEFRPLSLPRAPAGRTKLHVGK